MNKLLLITALLLTSFDAYAVNLILDPTIEGQKNFTVTCEYPVEREDNTPLDVSEIAKVNFFVEKNGAGGYLPAGENTTACRQVYDISEIPDGVYIYAATVTDTDGRESIYSSADNVVNLTIKRLASPKPPAGVTVVHF